jgi:hypothetical protein
MRLLGGLRQKPLNSPTGPGKSQPVIEGIFITNDAKMSEF